MNTWWDPPADRMLLISLISTYVFLFWYSHVYILLLNNFYKLCSIMLICISLHSFVIMLICTVYHHNDFCWIQVLNSKFDWKQTFKQSWKSFISSHPCAGYSPWLAIWGWYHGGRWPSSNDSLHSPTVIPPLALDKLSIMKRYHRQWTTRWGVTERSPTMVTLHDTRFVECLWWNDGWTVKTVITWRSSASMIRPLVN